MKSKNSHPNSTLPRGHSGSLSQYLAMVLNPFKSDNMPAENTSATPLLGMNRPITNQPPTSQP